MNTKKCNSCGNESPVDNFVKNVTAKDGLAWACRDCTKKQRESRKPALKAYNRKYRQADKEQVRESNRRWRARNRESVRTTNYKWRKRNPGKHRTHMLFSAAVLRGELVAPDRCETCLREMSLQGHHDDYSKPMEVRWLCAICHTNHHIQEK